MTKRQLFLFLHYYNIIYAVWVFALFFATVFSEDVGWYDGEQVIILRFLGVLPILPFWIWNLVICYKKDPTARIFLLFFLNGLYTPFYSRRVLTNNWV